MQFCSLGVSNGKENYCSNFESQQWYIRSFLFVLVFVALRIFFFFFLFAIGPQSLNFEEKGEVTVKETFWNKIEYFLELNV